METEPKPSSHSQLGRTFITQQRVISMLSFFLPVFLVTWSVVTDAGIRGSLSEYYYTPVRDIFVGVLCALALFLWSYRGYHPYNPELRADRIVAKVASVAAALTALAPLNPRQRGECTLLQCVLGIQVTDWIHNIAAAVFMAALATFCLVLFPMTAIPGPGKSRRLLRCRTCKARFSERKGTPLFDSRLPPEKAVSILEHVAEGCGVRQTGRLCRVAPNTVARYSRVAGEHAEAAHDELVGLSPPDDRGPVR